MQESSSYIISLTIIISTFLLFVFGIIITRYIFLYQRKRYLHQQEVLELRETFIQTLLQSKIEIQEQTLDHISKELHANVGHLVSLININLSEILPTSFGETKKNVLETKSLAKQLLLELKTLSASLNTDLIIKIGFAKALENELNRFKKLDRCILTYTKEGDEYRLSPEQEIILLRLCQEALNNVIKYAKAASVAVSLNYLDTAIELKIIDNGVGFDVDGAAVLAAEKQSTGILNMQKRAKLINADFSITSLPGKGTKVDILIPKQIVP